MENIDKLVKELCKLPNETGWVEFKHNNCSPEMIGQDISALANSVVLAGRNHAYMIWGVDDKSHEIIGTDIHLKSLKKGNEEIENWLRHQLSKYADICFLSVDVDCRHVELIVIGKAVATPVAFEKVEYIRSGSYTKKLMDLPALQAQLWDRLRNEQFEDTYAKTDLRLHDVMQLLNCNNYFRLVQKPMPETEEGYIHYMLQEGILAKQDNGFYAITSLGAVLLANNLAEFSRIGRKAIRIIQYEGNNRLTILKEEELTEGNATSLEKAVKYVNTLLPSKEDINEVKRQRHSPFPLPAIREAIANALIHQDLFITGAGPVIELFANRVEVTNPGTPLVSVMRIVDNPPKSRNEKLSSLMRRMGMCEELGRGWDRMVIACELQQLPAPRMQVYEESTKVSLFSQLRFSNISTEDKIWSTYLHACIKYLEGDAMTNSSLRERFGLKATSSGSASRLIKETLEQRFIKPLEPGTARRYMRYIPAWA